MIWTNSAPNAQFSAQTITTSDFSDAEYLIVESKYFYAYDLCHGYTLIPTNVANYYGNTSAPDARNNTGTRYCGTRKCKVASTNSVQFFNGCAIDESASTATYSAQFAIPLKIYKVTSSLIPS